MGTRNTYIKFLSRRLASLFEEDCYLGGPFAGDPNRAGRYNVPKYLGEPSTWEFLLYNPNKLKKY